MRRTNGLMMLLLFAVGSVATFSGCAHRTHAQDKQAAYDRWSEARTGILYSLALEQFQTGDLDTAYQSCKQGMSATPDQPHFYELAGRIMIEKGSLELAHKFITRAIELEAEGGNAQYLLGVVHQRWRQYDRALECYEKAAAEQIDDLSGLMAASEMLVKLDRSEEALSKLSGVLRHNEHNSALRASIARIHMMHRRYDQAVKWYRQAQLLSPDDPLIGEQLGLAELAAGNHLEATYQLGRVLKHEEAKQRTDLKLALVDCYLATNNPAEAGRLCLDLTRAEPDHVDAWVRLGQAAFLLQEDLTLGRAVARLNALAPDRYESHLMQGMMAQRQADDVAAAAHYTRAAQLAPDQAIPWLMQGMALERTGRIHQAEAAYRHAATLAPNDPRPRTLLTGLSEMD